MYEMIIWATDGSAAADLALGEALGLRRLSGGRLVAVHCNQRLTGRAAPWPALADEDERLMKIRRQVAKLREDGVDVDLIVRQSHRDAADVVATIADELDGNVIVCGTRGHSGWGGTFVGSFTRRIMQLAPCPVLAVRTQDALASELERHMVEVTA